MRFDMQKVIVERPRRGSRLPNRGTARRIQPVEVVDDDFDSGPKRAKGVGREKWLNEHLNPLWRFLRSNLGRPWGRVYSEILERLDSRSVLGSHVLDHLRWEVATNCYFEGKQLIAVGRWRHYPVEGFYVHPKTGILHETAPRSRKVWRKKQREIRWVVSPDRDLYEVFNGLWFWVRYETRDGEDVLIEKRQCPRKQVQEIESWIDAAKRGKRGYERGADYVRAPGSFEPELAA